MKLYRYINHSTELGSSLLLLVFDVLRETPKGYWIQDIPGERFVLKKSRRCFAHQTKEDALKSLVARRRRQITILEHQLTNAREVLAIATSGDPIPEENFMDLPVRPLLT